MNFMKPLSNLEKKAPNFLKKTETPNFRFWKTLAIVLGFSQNIGLGIDAFEHDKIVQGILFILGLNAIFFCLLIAAKYLRYITTKYRYIYIVIAFSPTIALLYHLYNKA